MAECQKLSSHMLMLCAVQVPKICAGVCQKSSVTSAMKIAQCANKMAFSLLA